MATGTADYHDDLVLAIAGRRGSETKTEVEIERLDALLIAEQRLPHMRCEIEAEARTAWQRLGDARFVLRRMRELYGREGDRLIADLWKDHLRFLLRLRRISQGRA